MRIVIDIEANKLINPTEIWCIVCKDIDTGEYYKFRNVTTDEVSKAAFKDFSTAVDLYIGHNILGYDVPHLRRLLGIELGPISRYCDTFIMSKLVDYSRQSGHSIESYGLEFGIEKGKFSDWSKWSQEMEDYCVRDVDICHQIYLKYLDIIADQAWAPAIELEHQFQLVCNNLHDSGFAFDADGARNLLATVTAKLKKLDTDILKQFPPKLKLIREVHPEVTKHGTLHRKDFRFVLDGDLSMYNGGPFSRCVWHPFNPASHKQVVETLASAGWSPVDKTQTHINVEREINRQKYIAEDKRTVDLAALSSKLIILQKSGWKINEQNLSTLPPSAPPPARTLAQRILYESRRRTLTEWLGLVHPDTLRIHGSFQGIGAWTHRMAHQKPNTANIPLAFDNATGKIKLLGKEFRSLWCAPKDRLLLGVDAEGIQFRIAAHYINDKELIDRLVNGKKSDKTDPHSFNQSLFGPVCKTRQAAKQVLFSTFLGVGIKKLTSILDASEEEARKIIGILLKQYPGIDYVRREMAAKDGKRGYFIGLDGRKVPIPGDTIGERKHLAPSGYLQCGEAVVIKAAGVHFDSELKDYDSFLVDIVHDEFQIETPNDLQITLKVAEIVAEAIKWAGKELKLNCPMQGSYYNDDKRDYTIGTNWYQTH